MPTERRLLGELGAVRLWLALAITTGVLAAASYILLAIFLSDIVQRIFLEEQSLNDVSSTLYTMLLLLLVRGGAIWSKELFAQRSASKLKGNFHRRLSQKLSDLGPLYTRGERSGELVSTLVEGVESLDNFVTQYLTAKALGVIVPSLIFLVILSLDPWTTLIFLVATPMMALILALIGGRARAITERRFLEMSWMSAFFLDILQGLTTLKLFGRDHEQAQNIRQISDEYANSTMEILRTAFQSSLVMEWAATAATAMVALTVSLRLMNGALPFSTALTILILTPEFFLPIRQYALKFHAGTAGKAAAARIYAILDSKTDSQELSPVKNGTSLPQQLDIAFESVTFSYQPDQRPALQDFSMTIPEGCRLLIAGPTGSGKTTISQLLLRFARPDIGRILVGDNPLHALNATAWLRQIAWVPQLPYLFHGTIADNLRLARPGADMSEMTAAAIAAHAHDFITAFPLGYETPVGEQGAHLSGGQRQRLAIARALLKDASIVILDEPTAHLGQASEQVMQAALERLMTNRTIIIIAHRLRMDLRFDKIVLLERGRMAVTGSPADLTRPDSPYRRLIDSLYQPNSWGNAA